MSFLKGLEVENIVKCPPEWSEAPKMEYRSVYNPGGDRTLGDLASYSWENYHSELEKKMGIFDISEQVFDEMKPEKDPSLLASFLNSTILNAFGAKKADFDIAGNHAAGPPPEMSVIGVETPDGFQKERLRDAMVMWRLRHAPHPKEAEAVDWLLAQLDPDGFGLQSVKVPEQARLLVLEALIQFTQAHAHSQLDACHAARVQAALQQLTPRFEYQEVELPEDGANSEKIRHHLFQAFNERITFSKRDISSEEGLMLQFALGQVAPEQDLLALPYSQISNDKGELSTADEIKITIEAEIDARADAIRAENDEEYLYDEDIYKKVHLITRVGGPDHTEEVARRRRQPLQSLPESVLKKQQPPPKPPPASKVGFAPGGATAPTGSDGENGPAALVAAEITAEITNRLSSMGGTIKSFFTGEDPGAPPPSYLTAADPLANAQDASVNWMSAGLDDRTGLESKAFKALAIGSSKHLVADTMEDGPDEDVCLTCGGDHLLDDLADGITYTGAGTDAQPPPDAPPSPPEPDAQFTPRTLEKQREAAAAAAASGDDAPKTARGLLGTVSLLWRVQKKQSAGDHEKMPCWKQYFTIFIGSCLVGFLCVVTISLFAIIDPLPQYFTLFSTLISMPTSILVHQGHAHPPPYRPWYRMTPPSLPPLMTRGRCTRPRAPSCAGCVGGGRSGAVSRSRARSTISRGATVRSRVSSGASWMRARRCGRARRTCSR